MSLSESRMQEIFQDPSAILSQRLLLLPLSTTHTLELAELVESQQLWKTDYTTIPTAEVMDEYVQRMLMNRSKRKCLPYAIWLRSSQSVIGTIGIRNINFKHKRCEIGEIWISNNFRRVGINTESNLVLLDYAFNMLDVILIQYCADERNLASRRCLLRMGATEEGLLRAERIAPSGWIRNTVIYSFLKREWPEKKDAIISTLASHSS